MSNEQERIGVTDSEIIIGAGLPITGKLAWKGVAIEHAVKAYFNEINEKGGINGRKLRLVSCDDGYDPDKAVECFNGSFKDKVFASGFFTGSPTNPKYCRMGELNNMPLFGFLVGTPVAYEFAKNRFCLRPSYSHEADRHISRLWEKNKVRNFAIVLQNDALGAALRDGTAKALEKYGAQAVVEAGYSREKGDVEQALSQCIVAKPDVVVLAVSSGEIKRTVDFINKFKPRCLFLAFSPQDDAVLKCGTAADGMLVSQVTPPMDEKLPAIADYVKTLKKYYPTDEPKMCAAEAFLNAMVLAEALKKCGKDPTRTKFVSAFESLGNFDLGVGPQFKTHYSSKNHVGWTNNAIQLDEVRGGKLTPVTDKEVDGLLAKVRKLGS